jgi:hypothetical protein
MFTPTANRSRSVRAARKAPSVIGSREGKRSIAGGRDLA